MIDNNLNSKQLHRPTVQSGFTLLELLLVIALVAMLASISVARYSHYTQESNRRAAVTRLYATQQSMERARLQTGKYADLPSLTEHGYHFQFDAAADGSSYVLTATPIQGGDTDCGALSINQVDARQASGGNIADCWQ